MFSGGLLHVVVDRYKLPDGEIAVRELVLHPGAAAVLPILPDGRILLVEQFRAPVGKTLVEIPAGKLEPGETPLACARRELREETGYEADEFSAMFSILTTPGFSDERIHLFRADGLRRITDRDAREIDRVVLLAPAEAIARALDGRIEDAKTVLALVSFFQTPRIP